jgi:tyrosyl-tRNA synthetase
LMWKYYTLLTDLGPNEILQMQKQVSSGELHPKSAKVQLAKRIVTDFHGEAAASTAADEFERRFARKELVADSLEVLTWNLPDEKRAFRQVLVELKLAASGREADQKLKQGAVKVDGKKIENQLALQEQYLERGREYVLEVGRKAYKLRVV